MNRFKITTTKSGKCDVTLIIYDNNNNIIERKDSTYIVKPTVKELLNYAKSIKNAKKVFISTIPSCCKKTYIL